MSHTYEIEIKSLLGSRRNADTLSQKIIKRGGVQTGKNRQLNHYFTISDVQKFKESLTPTINKSRRKIFGKILDEGNDISVRTRDTDGEVLLVIKASVGTDSSSNGVSRMEFESEMKMSLEELDQLLLNVGLEYQAKWSREREEYKLDDTNVCIDRNAGYGYLAEFEKVVGESGDIKKAEEEIRHFMKELEIEELAQDRLERMFAHYNANWRDYYGTDNVFNIK